MAALKKPRLLFITQKIDDDFDNLGVAIWWIRAFVQEGFDVQVVCLEKGHTTLDVPIYSLGKELGKKKIFRLLAFYKYIFTLKYDRVFVHMNCEYMTLGGLYWFVKKIPTYLWYTHYTMHIHLRLAGLFCKRLFCATPQSLPQYSKSSKKIVLGHGVDIIYWTADLQKNYENNQDPFALLSVHRICRSKRIEINILALKYLPEEYTLSIYGRVHQRAYYQELQSLLKTHNLQGRVCFKGPVPMSQLKQVYRQHRLLLNMASETIDKTMLEAMLFGLYTVTTKSNSESIGLPFAPIEDTPEAVASFILEKKWNVIHTNDLQKIVKERHSAQKLIHNMSKYIFPGM